VTAGDAAQTGRNIRELTKVGECEIDELVLSCTRSRQLLNSVPITKPLCALAAPRDRKLCAVRVAMMWASLFTGTAFYSGLDSQGTDLASPFRSQVSARRLCQGLSLPSARAALRSSAA
jgi:hypothetical protein